MAERTQRKFTVADAMIFVAAIAIGLAWAQANRVADHNYRSILGPMSFIHETVWTDFEKAWTSLRTCMPVLEMDHPGSWS